MRWQEHGTCCQQPQKNCLGHRLTSISLQMTVLGRTWTYTQKFPNRASRSRCKTQNDNISPFSSTDYTNAHKPQSSTGNVPSFNNAKLISLVAVLKFMHRSWNQGCPNDQYRDLAPIFLPWISSQHCVPYSGTVPKPYLEAVTGIGLSMYVK